LTGTFQPVFQCKVYRSDLSSNEITNTISSSSETSSMNTQNDLTHFIIKTPKYVRILKPFKKFVQFFKYQSDTNDMTIHQYINVLYSKENLD